MPYQDDEELDDPKAPEDEGLPLQASDSGEIPSEETVEAPPSNEDAPPLQSKEDYNAVIDKELGDSNLKESPAEDDELEPSPDEKSSELGESDLKPTLSPKETQLQKYQNFIDEYKRLQQHRRNTDLVSGLMTAGGQIGQAMAGKYSGHFTPDLAGAKAVQEIGSRPVTDFEQGQVVNSRQLQLGAEQAAHDPTSPQSKMVRDYVKTRLGLPLADDVSAADAQMLLKTVGRPMQTKYQKVNGSYTDEKGINHRVSASFDPSTHTYVDVNGNKLPDNFVAEGLNPFQVTKNQEGQDVVFNKSRGYSPNVVTPSGNFNTAKDPQEVYSQMTPVLKKELNDKIIPNFNKLTEKTQQRLMHQAPITAKLEEAQLNPAAYAQLQAELARFDVGDQRLAQQEFNMFATRHGYKGWGDWIQKNTSGTVSPGFADDFAHTINNTVHGMQTDLNKQAEKQAQLVINRLPPGQKTDPKIIAKLIYSGYKPDAVNIPKNRVHVVSPDGQEGHIPQDQVEEAQKQGFKVLNDGQ